MVPAVTVPDRVTVQKLEQALENLLVASKQPTKQRSHSVSDLILSICSYAYQNGLSAGTLTTIVEIITRPNQLDRTSLSSLVRNLYPAGQGQEKLSVWTQNLFLKWIVMIYDFLDDPAILSNLYGILFNLIDMISIRATLCHLLAITTQRKHVKPFRIQSLLELSRNVENEPALLGLLQVYKGYYPDVLLDQSTPGRASKFSHPDPEWRERVQIIQTNNAHIQKMAQMQTAPFKVVRKGAKRSRLPIVPEVHTHRAVESSTTLEEVDGIGDFIQKFDKLILPNQLISALDDPLLQKLVLLRPADASKMRIERWLTSFFDEQLRLIGENEDVSRSLIEILEKVLYYTRRTKTLPESVLLFMPGLLRNWAGCDQWKLILSILSYLPLQPFEELQLSILNVLETAVIDDTLDSAAVLLDFYSSLSRHWTSQILSHSSSSTQNMGTSSSGFSSITALTAHASLLSLNILASSFLTQSHISTVLSFHEALAETISHAPSHTQIHILTPASQSIYLLTFQCSSLSNLSRLCFILAIYKRTFEAAMAHPTHEYPRDYVNHFNGFLMDICNLLWRSRAFNTSDTNALGCLLAPSILPLLRTHVEALKPPQSVTSLFSLSNNSAICALSIAAFRDLEDKSEEGEEGSVQMRHAGPVGQRSLAALAADGGITVGWAEYRLEVLKWLGEIGVDGIGQLMFCTMKHLMGPAKGATA